MFSICNDGESKTQGTTWVAIGHTGSCLRAQGLHALSTISAVAETKPDARRSMALASEFRSQWRLKERTPVAQPECSACLSVGTTGMVPRYPSV